MTAPKRIQRQRTKGWRKPQGAVIVDRTSKWGNPFKIGDDNVPDAEAAVSKFESWCTEIEADELEELRGKDLVCFCPLDQPCHADILIKWANPPLSE